MKKILIIDDDSLLRSLLKETLNTIHDDLEISDTCDGTRAFDFLDKNKVDLIVTDLSMSSFYGEQFVINLEKKYKTPIIIYSGTTYTLKKDSPLFTNPNIKGIIEKPYHGKLFDKINELKS
jgi:chemotaxis response regulator CheB